MTMPRAQAIDSPYVEAVAAPTRAGSTGCRDAGSSDEPTEPQAVGHTRGAALVREMTPKLETPREPT